jgi:hypothetical protein
MFPCVSIPSGRRILKELCYGLYATRFGLPLSDLSRGLRRFGRRLRGKTAANAALPRLPQVRWTRCAQSRFMRVYETPKANGNVHMSELAILNAFAADCDDRSVLFEIGTFDGRTTLNLALNAPAQCRVYTLDLPAAADTRYPLDNGELHMLGKGESGRRYERYRASKPHAVERICELWGDSGTFDFAPYESSCSLVFVDGSHSADYVRSDSLAAMRLAKPGGRVVWHDYGVWDDVTRGLEELDRVENLGLRHIKGTSLVCWRKPLVSQG